MGPICHHKSTLTNHIQAAKPPLPLKQERPLNQNITQTHFFKKINSYISREKKHDKKSIIIQKLCWCAMSVCMRARIATGPNQGPSISEYSWAGGPPPLHLLRRREHPRRIATDEEEAIAGGARHRRGARGGGVLPGEPLHHVPEARLVRAHSPSPCASPSPPPASSFSSPPPPQLAAALIWSDSHQRRRELASLANYCDDLHCYSTHPY